MHIGIHDHNNFCNIDNSIFKSDTYAIGENLNAPALALKVQLEALGHSLDTLDRRPLQQFDKIIFIDMPSENQVDLEYVSQLGIELYLVMLESNIIWPLNYDLGMHRFFKKIFTWDDAFVDNVKYHKVMISHKWPAAEDLPAGDRNRFCCMIAGNKRSQLKGELYTERRRAIRWMERNHPENFDLFGFGWDRYEFPGYAPVRYLNRFAALHKVLAPRHPCFRGQVTSKREVLRNYKFSFCYENVAGSKGYISEKIFDSLFSLCVPIYAGAPDVKDYIPSDCFIDKADFSDYGALYDYVSNMDAVEYRTRQRAIEAFLFSDKSKQFSADVFADTIIRQLVAIG